MALIVYRRHVKACSKGYEQNHRIFPPGTLKEIRADCSCPIACSGTTPSQPVKLRHLSLDTNDWDKARKIVKQLEAGSLVEPETQPKSIAFDEAATRFLAYKGPKGQNIGKDARSKYRTMLVDRTSLFVSSVRLNPLRHLMTRTL